MKHICLFLLITCLGIWACNSKPTTHPQRKYFSGEETLYNYAPTKDKTFCNPDSVINTDCWFGDIYFTKNKHVVYTFYCMGDDSTKYQIGKYILTNDGITCTFDQTYSFYVGEPGETTVTDPNKGILRKVKPSSVKLKKLSCDKFDYSFEDRSRDFYVLSESNKEQTDYYFNQYKQIKALSDL